MRSRVHQRHRWLLMWIILRCRLVFLRANASRRKHTSQSSHWSMDRYSASGKKILKTQTRGRNPRHWLKWLRQLKKPPISYLNQPMSLKRKTSTYSSSSSMCAQPSFARKSKVMNYVTALRRLIERFVSCTFKTSRRYRRKAKNVDSGWHRKSPSLRLFRGVDKKLTTR